MKRETMEYTCENDYFCARQEGPVVVFTPKGNFLISATIIKAKEAILDYFRSADKNPEIRVVVMLPPPRKARREEYLSFFNMVESRRLTKSSVMRLYRTIDQLIVDILSSDLFFISANCGEILPIFVNIALACDYRIIGDNAVFQNPALEVGLISKGGGAWLLNNLLGRGRAMDLILMEGNLSAKAAMATGLVEKCVPVADLEKEAITVARRFAAKPATSLRLAKRLINHSMAGFAEYLEYETQEMLKALHENQLLK
jgi:enoyl-CoA hydratase/carnithine racemase